MFVISSQEPSGKVSCVVALAVCPVMARDPCPSLEPAGLKAKV